MLIQNAELHGVRRDIRLQHGVISDIGQDISRLPNEPILDARDGALLPSLRDDHIHLRAMAATRRSVFCGPPTVANAAQLSHVLQHATGRHWIRGVGYHESVAGDLTATSIDQWQNSRPVRIQHRSGRLWYLNSLAARAIGLPREKQGQLYRQDETLIKSIPPLEDLESALGEVSRELASFGVTHVTDATPSNDMAASAWLQEHCPYQDVYAMGSERLGSGHLKLILDDYQLPDFTVCCQRIQAAHKQGRPVAIHCVSAVEVVFAVAALDEVGTMTGDRLEHGTELSRQVIHKIARLNLKVVPNPNFLLTRGDQYLKDNEEAVLKTLFPLRSLVDEGVPLTGGTDAPFGESDPWQAMRAAKDRLTRNGVEIGAHEAIEPEDARAMFSVAPQIALKQPADLMLLKRPWSSARLRLSSQDVRATFRCGELTYLSD